MRLKSKETPEPQLHELRATSYAQHYFKFWSLFSFLAPACVDVSQLPKMQHWKGTLTSALQRRQRLFHIPRASNNFQKKNCLKQRNYPIPYASHHNSRLLVPPSFATYKTITKQSYSSNQHVVRHQTQYNRRRAFDSSQEEFGHDCVLPSR